MPRVLGVDACRAGWVGIAVDEPGAGRPAFGYVGPTVEDLVDEAERDGRVDVVGVDIPIGLPDRGRRRADELARLAVGPRRSAVFLTPVRSALGAPDHATAVRRNRALTGEGVSIQAYGLRHRIFEVEQWAGVFPRTVLEVHPEVCFAHLAGSPLSTRKSTWAGAEVRRTLLAEIGIDLAHIGPAGAHAGVDDVLDAAAAAWTAARHARGDAVPLPDPPEVFEDGIPCAIWV
jgi:predicted RNase H-like nuclease